MTKHPGKTSAQKRILDEIGCGNHAPIMAKSTMARMLADGLIVEIGSRSEPFIGGLKMTIRQFDMPTPVHMAWCDFQSEQHDKDAPHD